MCYMRLFAVLVWAKVEILAVLLRLLYICVCFVVVSFEISVNYRKMLMWFIACGVL